MNPSLLDNISLRDIPTILPLLTTAEQEQLLAQLSHLEKLKHKTLVQKKFIEFVHHVWPSFIGGRHHKVMAEAFERVAKGECKRLIINMPPRHTKSEFASYLSRQVPPQESYPDLEYCGVSSGVWP